jgi:hypothetical protein
MAFDLCCKISYYVYSSFLNIHVKNLYYSFICIRPIALSGLIFYNYIYALLDIKDFANKGKNVPAPLVVLNENDEKEEEKPERYIKEGGEVEMIEGGYNTYQNTESNENLNANHLNQYNQDVSGYDSQSHMMNGHQNSTGHMFNQEQLDPEIIIQKQ